MATHVSDENKKIARLVAASFGGNQKVDEFWDERHESMIAVLSAVNSPEEGFTSYCTIGLSDFPLSGVLQPPLGSEICGVSEEDGFAAVLATAAFCVINSQWVAEPGRIFPKVVSLNLPSVSVPNLLLVSPPYLWDGLESRAFDSKTVAWLLGVPVTDAEMEFARTRGAEALEDKLDEHRVDVSNLHRESTI